MKSTINMMNLKFLLPASMLALLATSALVFADNILSIGHEADTVHLSWPTTEGGYRLQATGDPALPDWQDVSSTYADSRFHAFEVIDQPKRFYRLCKDSNPDGRITIEVLLFRFNALPFQPLPLDSGTSSPPDVYDYDCSIVNTKKLTFDASNAYNARTGSSSGMTFHWTIEYQNQTVPNPYRVAGITGYDSPVLTILPNSLIPTVEPEIVTLVLTVTDPLNPDLAKDETRFQITGEVASSATLADYHIANADPANAPNPNLIAVP